MASIDADRSACDAASHTFCIGRRTSMPVHSPLDFITHPCRWAPVVLLCLPLGCLAQDVASQGVADSSFSTLIVLLVGLGMILVAVGVIAFAVRQLRREARERRHLYRRRSRTDEDRPASSTSR
jgi:hypothetical protein